MASWPRPLRTTLNLSWNKALGRSAQGIDLWSSAVGYNVAEQCMRADVVHRNRQQLARLASIAVKYDDSVAMGPADHLHNVCLNVRVLSELARSLDEHFDFLSDESLVIFFADSILNLEQCVVAFLLDAQWNVVFHVFGAFCPWPLAVLEDKAVLKPALFSQGNGLFKLPVRLAAEAYDEIA